MSAGRRACRSKFVAAMRRAAFSSGLTVRDLGISVAMMRVGRREVRRRMAVVNMMVVV